MDNTKTYVHDGVEVILTGRVAISEKKMASGKVIRSELVEVKPIKKPGVPVWEKWVKPKDLFEVAAAPVPESLDNPQEK
jgi:hypothetical protein